MVVRNRHRKIFRCTCLVFEFYVESCICRFINGINCLVFVFANSFCVIVNISSRSVPIHVLALSDALVVKKFDPANHWADNPACSQGLPTSTPCHCFVYSASDRKLYELPTDCTTIVCQCLNIPELCQMRNISHAFKNMANNSLDFTRTVSHRAGKDGDALEWLRGVHSVCPRISAVDIVRFVFVSSAHFQRSLL